jgi:hypothetical protein
MLYIKEFDTGGLQLQIFTNPALPALVSISI